MKFLHTGDWQIGMQATRTGAAANRVRSERIEAAKRVVAAANERACDFVLVAGDTFEDNGVERTVVQRIGDILAGFNGPVYLIPGNHDPYIPGCVWEHTVWNTANLHVLHQAVLVEIPGGTLFPCPLFAKNSTADPTAWINAADRPEICIGLGHGTVEGVQVEEPDYPIPRNAAQRSGLDYLAIGHWHSFGEVPCDGEPARIAYSGTHETTKFKERDSGKALLVEIEHRGAAPTLAAIPTGGLTWQVWERTITGPGELGELLAEMEAVDQPQNTLLSVRLSGLLPGEDNQSLLRIKELAAPEAGRFLFAEVIDNLLPAPDDDSWMENAPPGLVRNVLQRLRTYASGGGEDRPDYATPEVSARAIAELYQLISNSSQ